VLHLAPALAERGKTLTMSATSTTGRGHGTYTTGRGHGTYTTGRGHGTYG